MDVVCPDDPRRPALSTRSFFDSSRSPTTYNPDNIYHLPSVPLQQSLLVLGTRPNMEKITHKIAALPPDSNYFSLEFFPPKTQMVGLPRATEIHCRHWF